MPVTVDCLGYAEKSVGRRAVFVLGLSCLSDSTPAERTLPACLGHLQVLYKLDRSGQGEEICLADLPRNTGLSFVGFNHNMFLEVSFRHTGSICSLPHEQPRR